MRGIQVDKREKFISIASSSGKDILTLQDIKDLCVENDIKLPQWYLKDMDFRAGRGLYKIPNTKFSKWFMLSTPIFYRWIHLILKV